MKRTAKRRQVGALQNPASHKKHNNFMAAIGSCFGHHNSVNLRNTLLTMPAMAAAGVSELWTVADLVERADG